MTRMTATTYTLGIEEEYQIIDADTGELVPGAQHLLADAEAEMGTTVQRELKDSQIEIASDVCMSLADVRAAIVRSRSILLEHAAHQNAFIAAAGTHPFSDWHRQTTTPKPTYHILMADYQQLAREQLIFGCHVHVGLEDRDEAVQVMNRARQWLSPLVALSASSPFWQGDDTGYASFRTALWSRWPMSGPPPIVRSYAEYRQLVDTIISTGSVKDAGRIYWDIRLSASHETIEFRVMDVCHTTDEAVMVAALVRALVRTCHEEVLRGAPFEPTPTEVLRSAAWRAARYGLGGELFDVRAGELVPVRKLMERFLNYLRDALEAEGDWEEVAHRVEETIRRGNGAERQRAAYQRSGRMEDVIDLIRRETAAGLPGRE